MFKLNVALRPEASNRLDLLKMNLIMSHLVDMICGALSLKDI